MSRSRSARLPAASGARVRAAPITRGMLLRLGLYWGTLAILGVGSCTLTFWILASATGILNLGAQELFFIRAVGLIAVGLAAAGIFFIVGALRRVTLPIRDMTESAERIAQGDYSARVREQGPRELRSLGRSFNRMAEQLASNENERRTLIGNIAGELRTPLSMLKENIEGLLDGNFARDDAHLNLILGETIRLSALVEDMRMLALAESGGLILHREPTDLNVLVRETVALYHRDASAHNVSLHAIVTETPLIAHIDSVRLKQVIGILLDSALKDNLKSDVRIEVSRVKTLDDPPVERGQIEIAYRAGVISPENLKGYFDRFYVRDGGRDNQDSGLGLAISKLLVQAHAGEITVSSDTRRGTQVRITLPLERETFSP